MHILLGRGADTCDCIAVELPLKLMTSVVPEENGAWLSYFVQLLLFGQTLLIDKGADMHSMETCRDNRHGSLPRY